MTRTKTIKKDFGGLRGFGRIILRSPMKHSLLDPFSREATLRPSNPFTSPKPIK